MSRATIAALLSVSFRCTRVRCRERFLCWRRSRPGLRQVDDVGNLGLDDFDGDDTGFKVIAGFRPFKIFAIEANYVDLGSAKDNVAGVDVKADTTGIDAFAVGILPIPFVDLFAKVGVISWNQDVDISSIASSDDSGEDFAYGVGAGLAFGSRGIARRIRTLRNPTHRFGGHDFGQLHVDLPLTVP